MPDLKPCPFCGGSDVKLRHYHAGNMSWVSCVGCGLEAPSETGVTDEQAVEYWNRRALSAGQAQPMSDDWRKRAASVLEGFDKAKAEPLVALANYGDIALSLLRSALAVPPAVPGEVERQTCPDCGRYKALTAQQASNGDCPKWWAVRDDEAARDCNNHGGKS